MFWFYSKQTIEKQKLNRSLNVQFQKNVMGLASQLKKKFKAITSLVQRTFPYWLLNLAAFRLCKIKRPLIMGFL